MLFNLANKIKLIKQHGITLYLAIIPEFLLTDSST